MLRYRSIAHISLLSVAGKSLFPLMSLGNQQDGIRDCLLLVLIIALNSNERSKKHMFKTTNLLKSDLSIRFLLPHEAVSEGTLPNIASKRNFYGLIIYYFKQNTSILANTTEFRVEFEVVV